MKTLVFASNEKLNVWVLSEIYNSKFSSDELRFESQMHCLYNNCYACRTLETLAGFSIRFWIEPFIWTSEATKMYFITYLWVQRKSARISFEVYWNTETLLWITGTQMVKWARKFYRSNLRRSSIKKLFLKISQYLQKNNCVKSTGLQLYWKENPAQVFSCEYCKKF